MQPQTSGVPVERFADAENTMVPEGLENGFPAEFKDRGGMYPRRGNATQARALEALGHAVESLAHSRLFVLEPWTAKADADAVQILMRLRRLVFLGCDEVVPLWERTFRFREHGAGRPVLSSPQANYVGQI